MVAVKEINWTTKTKNTIIRETEILSRMHHKNIAEMVGAFCPSTNSQKVYIAVELLCPGGELFDAISKYGHLTEAITKKVIHELLEALVYCHGLSSYTYIPVCLYIWVPLTEPTCSKFYTNDS